MLIEKTNQNWWTSKTKSQKIKHSIISGLCFIFFIGIVYYIFEDGFGKKGSSGVSGFIEQDNLRKSLGDWYQLVFYTFQANIYFVIIGMLYVFFANNKVIKNLFFCSSAFLLFCFFAMSVFNFESYKNNQYEASKTILVHFIIPITSFLMLFSIRKEIVLSWKILWINSLYITFYIVLTIIIYYTFDFTVDSQYPGKPLWIYGFLDYNSQIMFVPLNSMLLTVLGIIATLLLTPIIGMTLFLFFKFIFNIKIEKFRTRRLNKTL